MMATFCLIVAGALPVGFWISVLLYMRLYGVSFKSAFVCIYRAWQEPL